MRKRRIDSKESRTAEFTCMCRAASYGENDPLLRSDDYVARRLLPGWVAALFKVSIARKLLMRAAAPAGAYEWVIARTRYIDGVFSDASALGYRQVVLFGTRSIRFQAPYPEARFFELDIRTTQEAKKGQFAARGISVPETVAFVPVDFETASVHSRLKEAGFQLQERLGPHELEERYFAAADGRVVRRINGTQSVALARRRSAEGSSSI